MFLPGSILDPRCRTIISPIETFCPSARLTPRYFGFESFRFLAVPPAFVVAMKLACSLQLAASRIQACKIYRRRGRKSRMVWKTSFRSAVPSLLWFLSGSHPLVWGGFLQARKHDRSFRYGTRNFQ